MVNLPWVHFGGVGSGEGLGDRSLTLTPDAFLLTTFRGFFGGGGVAIALHLPARVLDDSTLGPVDESPTDSTLRVWAKIRTTGTGESPSKPWMEEMRLSKACKCI
jgi:hypothetical protein